MASASLLRLLDRDRLTAILEAAATGLGGSGLAILDPRGRTIAAAGAAIDSTDAGGAARRPLEVQGAIAGELVIHGQVEPWALEVIGRSVELALTETAVRRDLAVTALDNYRELSVMYRIGETIGATLDASAIAGFVLSEVDRVLRPSASIVSPAADSPVPVVPASHGAADLVPLLEPAAAELLATVERRREPDLAEPGSGPFGSLVAAPLRTDRGHLGTVVLARRRGERPYQAGDLKLLGAIAGHAAIAFERASLHRSDTDRQRMEQELAIGRRIQLALMPRRFPSLVGWEFAAAYEAAREVGGDFYDAFGLRGQPGKVGLVVADVTGKGIASALLMADARALVHAAADSTDDPAETLNRVNRILVEERAISLFITIFHAVLDGATGRLRFASAGHDPTILLRAGGEASLLEAPGMLAGMTLDPGLETRAVVLGPGDAIVAYTDGITEARDPNGGFFGEERLLACLAASAGEAAAEIVGRLMAEVRIFRGTAEPADDLTVLVVRRQPVAADGSPPDPG